MISFNLGIEFVLFPSRWSLKTRLRVYINIFRIFCPLQTFPRDFFPQHFIDFFIVLHSTSNRQGLQTSIPSYIYGNLLRFRLCILKMYVCHAPTLSRKYVLFRLQFEKKKKKEDDLKEQN